MKVQDTLAACRLGRRRSSKQQAAADDDRRIGDVERGPVIVAEVEVQKVGDPAPHDAVEDIAGGAAENQREAPERRAVEPLGVPEHGGDKDHGGAGEDDQ